METYSLVYGNDLDIIEDYCSNSSDKAATAFVRKHQSFVFSCALRYLNNYDEAEDASQEVFIKALKNLHKFRRTSNIKTWLYKITANTCINIKRKKSVLSIFGKSSLSDAENLPGNTRAPDYELENSDFQIKFSNILANLPEKQRETFALRYFDNMTYEEISNILGTSIGGLKANYYQAVKKIAAIMKEGN